MLVVFTTRFFVRVVVTSIDANSIFVVSCSSGSNRHSRHVFGHFTGGSVLSAGNFRFDCNFRSYPNFKTGSGLSSVGLPAVKCSLHTLDEFLGSQSPPFLFCLLISLAHRSLPSLSLRSVGKRRSRNGGLQSHVAVPLGQL